MKTLVLAALGECVHVAGLMKIRSLAKQAGWNVEFLGPAVDTTSVIQAAKSHHADMVGVSYRLTPETGERLLAEFAEQADGLRDAGVRFAFGGTPPVVEKARKIGFFEASFDGTEPVEQVIAYLRGESEQSGEKSIPPQNMPDRRKWKSPYPLFRHHFGLPTMEDTVAGIEKIAEAGILDVISLGIDQDAQENFFHPEKQLLRRKGAGGVPVRSADDYRQLYQASRRGNYPIMRTYSGTDDFIALAEMYRDTINICWAAVPLYWFNRMDGRGPWDLEGSIKEHQELMAWYGEQDIPVEANEAHHWGMRDASDEIFVTSAYLAAYQAKKFGVKDHIVQMMFNSPPGTADVMDVAKMEAVKQMVNRLAEPDFRIWLQTRTGLLSYPVDEDLARGHLAASVYLQMAVKPDIVHVVGYSEADHAATPEEVIASVKIARQAAANAIAGQPNMLADPRITERKEELVAESELLLQAIQALGEHSDDPLSDAHTLAQAVSTGLMDAPQLNNNPFARGALVTRIDERGACVPVDSQTGQPITTKERITSVQSRRLA